MTSHEYRLFLKNMTVMKSDDDSTVHFYAFKFTSYDKNFKAKNEDSYLIDNFLKS